MSNNNAAQAEKVSQNPFDIFLIRPPGIKSLFLQGLFNAVQIRKHILSLLVPKPDQD